MKQVVERFSREEIVAMRRRLTAWFLVNRRDLPWRQSRDPYAIWVSEVMLQQTRIAAVVPYYLKFMKRFPTVAALAEANEQDVLRLWEGLGYYRRARHLHRAARVIIQEHAGQFPRQADSLAALPGLGRYTVGAVLSQAFDRRLAIVDANVARVLCRLGAWRGELQKRDTQEWLWQTAEALLPRRGVGDFNQALMELGQTVCAPRQPACLLCPLREVCQARAEGIAENLPRRGVKQELVETHEVAFIIHRKGRLLLGQRKPDAVRWANMWEFPTSAMVNEEDAEAKATEFVKRLSGTLINKPATFGTIRYGVTRFRISLQGITAEHKGGSLHRELYQDLRWVKTDELQHYPLSIPQRRLAKLWMESGNPARQ
jgi:A/G-specific adenine glycosylase